jgi:hypothetical protein
MWRVATPSDDEAVVSMCIELNAEDPGPTPVRPQQVRCTLAKLLEDANRGRAVVCDVEGRTVGYALLIPFWSNELEEKFATSTSCLLLPSIVGVAWGQPSFEALLRGTHRCGLLSR